MFSLSIITFLKNLEKQGFSCKDDNHLVITWPPIFHKMWRISQIKKEKSLRNLRGYGISPICFWWIGLNLSIFVASLVDVC